MKTPVDFHRLAIAEARGERRYYARISAALAGRFLADLDDAVARVAAAPALGVPHLLGTRLLRFRHFPFHLVYVEEPAGVLVLAVANNHRRPGYWRRRVP